MELFLDSGNSEAIAQLSSKQLIDGVTTNPVILARDAPHDRPFIEVAHEILEAARGVPVMFQAIGRDRDELVDHARKISEELSRFGEPIVKIPFETGDAHPTYDGYAAISEASSEGIRVLATAIVTPTQAYLAASAGAEYSGLMLRPYDDVLSERLGINLAADGFLRSDDTAHLLEERGERLETYGSGLETLKRTSEIFERHGLETKLLVAGIRNPLQAAAVLQSSADAMTVPHSVFESLFVHEGTKRFVQATRTGAPENYRGFLYES